MTLRNTGNPPVTEPRNEALERGLAQLRKATELAVGYQPQLVTRTEASAVLDHLADLERLAEAVRAYIAEPTRDNEDRLAQANLEAHRA